MSSPSHERQDSGEIDHPEVSGKLVILTILGLAVLGTGYAWWHQKQRGHQALDFWGQETAFAIRHGKEIELIRLDDENGNQSFPLGEARGLIHARQALIVDASYDWETEPTDVTPDWQYALRFPEEEDRGECSLWFDLEQELAGDESGKHVVRIKIAKGLRTFFEEQAADPGDTTPAAPIAKEPVITE